MSDSPAVIIFGRKATLDGYEEKVGQKTMGGSFPVVLASDQSNVPTQIDGYSIGPLPVMMVSPTIVHTSTSIDGYSIGPFPVQVTNNLLGERLDGYSTGPLPVMVVSPNRMQTSIDGYSVQHVPVKLVSPNSVGTNLDGYSVPFLPVKIVSPNRVGTSLDGYSVAHLPVRVTSFVNNVPVEKATFVALATNVQIGNNKSMVSIVNAIDSKVIAKIRTIYLRNSQTTTVTGVVVTFDLFRIANHAGGTAIIPESHDTADTLNSSITVRTGATVSLEAASPMYRWQQSSDEWRPNTLDTEALDATFSRFFPILWHQDPSTKPIVLRAGQGIHLKDRTNSISGQFDIMVVFTQE